MSISGWQLPSLEPEPVVAEPQLIADDAPFDLEQKKFLNGYLTALISVRDLRAAQKAAANVQGAPLTILYGSQTGNSEALTKDVRNFARNRGFSPEVSSLDQFDTDQLQSIELLLIICSTFGEGDPPDNAKSFMARIMESDMPELSNLKFSVCGLGDQSYTFFCKAGTDIDERLAQLGATRLADCAKCDVDYDDTFSAWKENVFSHAAIAETVEAFGGAVVEDEPDEAVEMAWSKANPFPATLLKVEKLSGHGSKKEVNHIEISLAGSGLEYEVGDALGLWPVNCFRDVQDLLDAGNFSGEEVVHFKGDAYPLRAVLLRKLDLHVLTPAVRKAMDLPVEEDWLRDRHLIDLLVEFAPMVEPQVLVDSLRPLQPRLYSIASSPKAHPGQVQLTVGAVRYTMHGRSRGGVASTYLADRLNPGGSVGVFLQKSPHFRLPSNPETPIIMVGPGTGIAPFRAFLEERIAVDAPGKSWLFFGDQHEASDFLYRDWITSTHAAGKISRLDLAWSRDGSEKVYVQNKMQAAGKELYQWLCDGAHFYVCGDASRMAKDVDAALRQVVAEHGDMSAEDANAYVDKLTADHRYQRDVY